MRAAIHTINGFSAHGDRDDLITWAKNFTTSPLFLVTHGEPESADAFADALDVEGMRSVVPEPGQVFDLVAEAPRTSSVRRRTAGKGDTGRLLSEIQVLLRDARETMPKDADESLLSLLRSSKTLLETAVEKASNEQEQR